MRWFLVSLLIAIALQATHAANDDDAAADDAVDYQYSSGAQVQPCEKGVVQVTSIELLCNSPYTFYYGNGANRQSQVCDYGDKANIEVSFTVTEDLEEGTDIFMKMAAFYGGEQLYRGDSVEVCYNFVGDACTALGDYTFKKKIQFAYSDGTYAKFIPTLEIAFSDSADGSYRLGGVNIDCEEYQDDDQNIVDWSDSDTEGTTTESIFLDYGILIGTVVVISGFTLFLVIHNRDGNEFSGPYDSKAAGLIKGMHR
jgi:hypothetical protein